MPHPVTSFLTFACVALGAGSALAAAPVCKAESAAALTPVIELYTSEGCSSCPPADRWLSTLKAVAGNGKAVVQAFHVGYWDYIGWVDRFATPAHTTRQRQVASQSGLSGVYTPQLIRNGRDSRDFANATRAGDAAKAQIQLLRNGDDSFEAVVTPAQDVGSWAAYWTVTENGHSSKVKAGENAGELLQHDFVVRQYVPLGEYKGASKVTLRTIAPNPAHPRQVNLVVFDPKTGKPLQALSLGC
ncbi:DUF1223 domain-containing protein [Caenimonas koreensis]|uniref:DUF1223 domain-containing protein n=1 Tax=Caenimonas koreensis DSM 17982 TaxID=1121255 RepID=A0A844BEB8_9BURK|nr:DUF1223 domain-containing protein [Caenimonas koreensis]MRD49777.1 DUF1223 domain-containing protein [Caenimonas koreensis DSM 17982]